MLKCRTSGKTNDAMLRSGVGGPAGEWISSQTVHRRIVDDNAAFFHGGNFRTHAQKDGRQIAIDGLPPCRLGHDCNWRGPPATTTIVEGIVQLAMLLDDSRDQTRDRFAVADVSGHPLCVTILRERLERMLSRALVAAGDHNPRGLARKCTCCS